MSVLAFRPRNTSYPKPFRLGFLSSHNPYDRRAFSGTCFYAARALRACPNIDLTIIGTHSKQLGPIRRLLKRDHSFEPDFQDIGALDAVVGVVATSLLKNFAVTHPETPYLHVTDATPTYLREAYGWAIPEQAYLDETFVAQNAAANVYSSQYIADRAPADLALPFMERAVIPFGLNFEESPDRLPGKPPLGKINLCFINTDWTRKGGDIAVAVLERLQAAKVPCELTVVGDLPHEFRRKQGVRHVGFLNKNRPRQAAKLARIYRNAHLLLLPSRADCTPMVLAEAMAFGTPVIASDVGGIGEMMGGPGTGCLLPPQAGPETWALAVQELMRESEAYGLMSDTCFEHSGAGLSWATWASRIVELVKQITEEKTYRDLKAAISS